MNLVHQRIKIQHILLIFFTSHLLFSCKESQEKSVNQLDNFNKINFLTRSTPYKVDYYYFNYEDINQELKMSRIVRNVNLSFIDTLGNIFGKARPVFTTTLTNEEFDLLNRSLNIYLPKPIEGDSTIGVTDCSEVYRDVLVWKDKHNKPVGAIEFCFTCGSYNFYPKLQPRARIICDDKNNLGTLFYQMHIKAAISSKEDYLKDFFSIE
ncbi:MAG: hypothetical protein ACOVO2_23455 [Emticicia sp.]|uniref:hypothetical protein n=1 Tax=Emticicia sp. TaxID=1930953 RepID=UPI003BA697C4